MGNAAVTNADLWSNFHNPGSLGMFRKTALGVSYFNYHLLSTTGVSSLAFSLPVKPGVFGISLSRNGYAQYRELLTGLVFSKSFGDKISAGVKLDHLQISQGAEYGKKQMFIGEAGLLAKLTKHLQFGVHLFNANRAKWNDWQDERIPTTLSAGFCYTFSEKALANLEIEKSSYHPFDVRFGMEYKPVKTMAIRAGFNTYPQQLSLGIGMDFSGFGMDMAATWHPVLGISPGISLQYIFP